jgi:hypothetical protein
MLTFILIKCNVLLLRVYDSSLSFEKLFMKCDKCYRQVKQNSEVIYPFKVHKSYGKINSFLKFLTPYRVLKIYLRIIF